MFLRLNKLAFSYNHHHHHNSMPETDAASLQAFRSLVSDNINRVLETLKLGSESLSLTWIHRCFEMIPMIDNAFAKLMVAIDYPVSRWEAGSIDDYLDYTINLLELLNSIGSSLSHVNHACVSLTRALCRIERSPNLAIERMKEITTHDSINKSLKASTGHREEIRNPNGKEWIFHEAMMVMKSTEFWVCGIVLSGLKGDVRPIMEMMRNGSFMEEDGVVKEVERVNESVRLIVSSGVCESDRGAELKTRLEVLRNGLKGLREEEEALFGNVMAARNKVLQTLRNNQ